MEDDHRRPLAERPRLVCLGVAGVRPFGNAALPDFPKLLDPINRLSLRAFDRPADFCQFLVAVTAVVYIPGRLYFGPSRWFSIGPFDVQADRVLLYAAYFFIGAGVGAANFDRGLLSANGQLARSGWGWVIVTLVPYCLMWGLIAVKRELLGNPVFLPDWYEASYGLLFVAFSAAIMFTIFAYFLRFERSGWSVLDPLQADAYGIFLVHYPIVLWLQYWLFDFDLPRHRQGSGYLRAHSRSELGCDGGVAPNPGSDARPVRAPDQLFGLPPWSRPLR